MWTLHLGRRAKGGGAHSPPVPFINCYSVVFLLLVGSTEPSVMIKRMCIMAVSITGKVGSARSDLYICYFLVLQLNGAFHFIIVFFFLIL